MPRSFISIVLAMSALVAAPLANAGTSFPLLDQHGGVGGIPGGDGTILVFATGQASAVGLSQGSGLVNHTGWVSVFNGLVDRTPPEVVAPDDPVLEQAGLDGSPYALPPAQVRDDKDPDPAVLVTIGAFGIERRPYSDLGPLVFPLGDTTVVYTAVDSRGNEASDSMVVHVVDTTAPVITVQPNLVVEAESPDGTIVVLPEPMVTDLCDAAPVVSSDAPFRFPLGVTVVTYTATDASGNQAEAQMVVEVVDTTPPSVTLGTRHLQAEQTSLDGSLVDLPTPVVRDNATWPEDILVTHDAPEVFPLGSTTVTYTAIDATGNQATVTLEVVVRDSEPPRVSWASRPEGFHDQPVELVFGISDNCDAAPLVWIDPLPSHLEVDGGVYRAIYDSDGVYDVSVAVEDSSGNRTLLGGVVFGIDRTPPEEVTLRGLPPRVSFDSPGDWPVFFSGEEFPVKFNLRDPGAPEASGLARSVATLVGLQPGTFAEVSRVHLDDRTFMVMGSPPHGPFVVKDSTCTDPAACDPDGGLAIEKLHLGPYAVEVSVTDAAGNQTVSTYPFLLSDLLGAIEVATGHIHGMILQDMDAADPWLVQAEDLLGYHDGARVDAAYRAVQTHRLGNGLLYLRDVMKALARATQADPRADTSQERDLLARGAYAEVRRYWLDVTHGAIIAGDATTARDYLELARDALDQGDYLLTLQHLMQAYFFTQNSELELFVASDYLEILAHDMMIQLSEMMEDYLTIPGINGRDCVQAAQDEVDAAEALVDSEGNYNLRTITLMLHLNHASDILHGCIVDYVWVRYWQWGLVQVVKSYVQRGRVAAGMEIGCGNDPDDPECFAAEPLMGEASCRYREGLAFFDDRMVDDALDVYVQARCLMVALYDAAFPDDAIDMPGECDGVELFECYQPQ